MSNKPELLARLARTNAHPHPVVVSGRIIPSNGESWEPGSGTGFFVNVIDQWGREAHLVDASVSTRDRAQAIIDNAIGKPLDIWEE